MFLLEWCLKREWGNESKCKYRILHLCRGRTSAISKKHKNLEIWEIYPPTSLIRCVNSCMLLSWALNCTCTYTAENPREEMRGLQLRRCGSSLGPFQYRLARTRRQPNSSLPRAGTGHPGLGTKHCLELFAQGLVPLRWGCAREPKRTCQGPKTHPHVSALQQSSGEAQSGRRFLGTKGGTLWLWSFLPKTGALGP